MLCFLDPFLWLKTVLEPEDRGPDQLSAGGNWTPLVTMKAGTTKAGIQLGLGDGFQETGSENGICDQLRGNVAENPTRLVLIRRPFI